MTQTIPKGEEILVDIGYGWQIARWDDTRNNFVLADYNGSFYDSFYVSEEDIKNWAPLPPTEL